MNALRRVQSGAEASARWLVVLSAFAVSLPTAWISVATGLFLLAWLAAGHYAERLDAIRRHPVAAASALALGWMALSIAWSPAALRPATDAFWHYRELLLLPLMLSVVHDATWGRRTLMALMAGLALALAASYLRWLGVLEPFTGGGGPYSGFTGHTGFSLLMAFGAYACLWLWRAASGPLRAVWAVLGGAALFNLFFVGSGRTGQVAFLGLLPLLLFRWLRWKGVIAGTLGALALAAGVYAASPTVHERVARTVADLRDYQAGHTDANDATRLEFWATSLELIRRHPVFGGGAGSFVAEYRDLAAARGWTDGHVADNPHNEYLMVWSQFGLVGLALLLGLWAVQWRSANAGDETTRYLLRGVLVLFMIGNLFNSLILDNMEGHLYALLSVALGAGWLHAREARA